MEEVCCEIKYSGAAGGALYAAVAATLALVTFAPFPDWARALAFAWAVGGAAVADGRLRSLRALRVDASGAIAVGDAAGAWRQGALRPRSFAAPWLTIVRWRPEGAILDRRLVLLPGMAPAPALRRLRVILRWA